MPILLHTVCTHAVEQIEDTGGIAVDEGCRHADAFFRGGEQLAHRVPLAAVRGKLVQFIRYQAVYLPSVPVFDIGAEREAAARAAGGHETVRLAQQGGKLLFRRRCFAGVPRKVRKTA
ncbi:hypothetical protein OCV66_15530, partial [Agathobaculum ammoniilyticum]